MNNLQTAYILETAAESGGRGRGGGRGGGVACVQTDTKSFSETLRGGSSNHSGS